MIMYCWHSIKLEGVHCAVAQPCSDQIRHNMQLQSRCDFDINLYAEPRIGVWNVLWDVVALETPTNTCHYCLSVVCAVENLVALKRAVRMWDNSGGCRLACRQRLEYCR
jgi:hypothetical protein